VLDQLVAESLQENRDLVQAAARVEPVPRRAAHHASPVLPAVQLQRRASRNRASQTSITPLPPGTDRNYSLYEAALGAAWQLDLFGRVRRQAEAAQAQVYASEQGRRGVVLSVVSATATAYIALRALDRQLEIARATEKNYLGSLQIFELRHKGGSVGARALAGRVAIPAGGGGDTELRAPGGAAGEPALGAARRNPGDIRAASRSSSSPIP